MTQHDLKVGDKVIISGAGAPYDGKHLVTSIPPDPHFPGALHQWKAILAPGPTPGTATGAVLAEKLSKPALLCTLSYSGTEVTVTTRVPHNRRINGDLARVVNTNTGLYVPELTTDAEDVLLSL